MHRQIYVIFQKIEVHIFSRKTYYNISHNKNQIIMVHKIIKLLDQFDN